MENEEILIPTKAVTPIGDFGCQSFPLIEGNVYNATEEELAKLGKHELKWSKDENGNPILIGNDPSAENLKAEMLARIAELKKQLADTDYEAIKFAEGEMSAEDYAPFKIQRAAWRAEINRLEEGVDAL